MGTNDSKPENWQYGAEFKADLEQMVKALKGSKIYLCTPIPAFKPSWNISDKVITEEIIPIQQKVARQYGLQIIYLHTMLASDSDKVIEDGIHPNEAGAKKMAEIIAKSIR